MDLLSEASNGPRVLTARHISDIPPEINHPINTTLLCHTYSLQPDFASYTAGIIVIVKYSHDNILFGFKVSMINEDQK